MSDIALLVYGPTAAEFMHLKGVLADDRLPLIRRLKRSYDQTIMEQLSDTDRLLDPVVQSEELQLLIVNERQVELIQRLQCIWRQIVGVNPEIILLTSSNRRWSGARLLQEISEERELANHYCKQIQIKG
ncbi:MAG: hypothetical protein ISR91_04925 [Candidatus Delongbacteria bacterium]|nr:hypothetical protein [Candidatus Delongbacteria bacterium]